MIEKGKYDNNSYRPEEWDDLWDASDHNVVINAEDSALVEKINTYFKGINDIEDVKSDPAYSDTLDKVKYMISDYNKSTRHNKENMDFVLSSMPVDIREAEIINEINEIKQEINQSTLGKIPAEWVKEWNEKKHRESGKDKKSEEIREFITSSVDPERSIADIDSPFPEKRSESGKTRIISFMSLAAAAIIGAVFLLRSLLPFSSPDTLFVRYYEPFSAISGVTRSNDAGGDQSFASALESYKKSNYKVAAAGFSEILADDPESNSSRFFLGITQLALNNFNQAVNLLEGVVGQQDEYSKEAIWYLGLAYLKAGDKAKASVCFGRLAQTPGFYEDRSAKILRRLK